jgi:hypothetical protein
VRQPFGFWDGCPPSIGIRLDATKQWRTPPGRVTDQALKRFPKLADRAPAKLCPPSFLNGPHPLAVGLLCFAPVEVSRSSFPPLAAGLDLTMAYPRLPRKLTDIAIASLETAAIRGRSRTAVPEMMCSRSRAMICGPMRHLTLELVVELDGKSNQCLRQKGGQGQVVRRIEPLHSHRGHQGVIGVALLSSGAFTVSIPGLMCENRSPAKSSNFAKVNLECQIKHPARSRLKSLVQATPLW